MARQVLVCRNLAKDVQQGNRYVHDLHLYLLRTKFSPLFLAALEDLVYRSLRSIHSSNRGVVTLKLLLSNTSGYSFRIALVSAGESPFFSKRVRKSDHPLSTCANSALAENTAVWGFEPATASSAGS